MQGSPAPNRWYSYISRKKAWKKQHWTEMALGRRNFLVSNSSTTGRKRDEMPGPRPSGQLWASDTLFFGQWDCKLLHMTRQCIQNSPRILTAWLLLRLTPCSSRRLWRPSEGPVQLFFPELESKEEMFLLFLGSLYPSIMRTCSGKTNWTLDCCK